MTSGDFDSFVRRATNDGSGGFDPYPFQRQLAVHGLPELLRAPTGSGKSLAAVLPWLWRRRMHPEVAVRDDTPRRLVIALPLRTLVDQLHDNAARWLDRLDLREDVGLHVLLGGRRDDEWRTAPGRDAIVIGSIDMLLSRALNRGYAVSRYRWPMEFGLISTDTQWVFDEVQLLGPALPTSRQLQAFRDLLGTHRPTRSMWMSATVDPNWLSTVDAPASPAPLEVDEVPAGSPLHAAVTATRRLAALLPDETDPPKPKDLASAIAAAHLRGSRTIVFVNTVARAQELHRRLRRLADTDLEVVLVHSRFRPDDRAAATRDATSEPVGPGGQIVISTQALEAGVDISSHTLITEVCPWTALVQRAGRCNRYGEVDGARLLWAPVKKAAPYDEADLEKTLALLGEHDGEDMTGRQLGELHVGTQPTHPVLRRRDLLALFDTLPDLSGDDVDVSPYVRDSEERDVFVAWRALDDQPSASLRLRDAELCRVPLGGFRDWRQKDRSPSADRWWVFDHIEEEWRRAQVSLLRPGARVLVDAQLGGYAPELGWSPRSRTTVPEAEHEPETGLSTNDQDGRVADPAVARRADEDEATGDDPLLDVVGPVRLDVHLRDAEREAVQLTRQVGLTGPDAEAVRLAALLHDLGKAHEAFQALLHEDAQVSSGVHLAKSRTGRGGTPRREGLRHEAATLAALRTPEGDALLREVGAGDPTVVRYLAAAHHGKVRIGARPLPKRSGGRADWVDPGGRTSLLGLAHGDRLPEVELGDGLRMESCVLDVEELAAFAGRDAWIDEALRLLERDGLAPFRLAFLEALVVLADWRASAAPSETIGASR